MNNLLNWLIILAVIATLVLSIVALVLPCKSGFEDEANCIANYQKCKPGYTCCDSGSQCTDTRSTSTCKSDSEYCQCRPPPGPSPPGPSPSPSPSCPLPDGGWGIPCGKECLSNKFGCCNGSKYEYDNQGCCNGKPYDNTKYGCCKFKNGTYKEYDLTYQQCCKTGIANINQQQFCCGDYVTPIAGGCIECKNIDGKSSERKLINYNTKPWKCGGIPDRKYSWWVGHHDYLQCRNGEPYYGGPPHKGTYIKMDQSSMESGYPKAYGPSCIQVYN